MFLEEVEESVGTTITNHTLLLHPVYEQLDPNKQSIICLGLNSILDLSAVFLERRATLFTRKQWSDLQARFPPVLFDTKPYDNIKLTLEPIFDACNPKKTKENNWTALYNEVFKLQALYNAEINELSRDVDFCLHYVNSLLILQKCHGYLFDQEIDKSEWDFLLKFWGPLLERPFHASGLRLKWEDTVLTTKDIATNEIFKVDVPFNNDKTIPRLYSKIEESGFHLTKVSIFRVSIRLHCNEEVDTTVAEAAKTDPGDSKYQSDRCKLFSESKVIIDNFLHETDELDIVYSIQFCGLEMMIMSLTLSANGLCIGNEAFHLQLNNNFNHFRNYLKGAIQLLCFRDEAIGVSNLCNNIKSTGTSKDTSVKGKGHNKNYRSKPPKSLKFTWKRGTWIPPRKSDSPLPAIPTNLVFR